MIKVNLQLFGGRGSGGGNNPSIKGAGESNKEAEALVSKLSAMKNAKSVGKYLTTPEMRAKVIDGLKSGDFLDLDYNDGKGIGVMIIQRENDTYFIGSFENMKQGTKQQVLKEMERVLKGKTTTGRGAFITRGFDTLQQVPFDYNPEGKTPSERVIYHRERIKKLK